MQSSTLPPGRLNRLEHRRQSDLAAKAFVARFFARFFVLFYRYQRLILSALGGMLGYHQLEGLSWLDSFLKPAIVMGGMEPINALQTAAGKLFAGVYALYPGLIFLVVTGLVFAPLVHRMLRLFNFDEEISMTTNRLHRWSCSLE